MQYILSNFEPFHEIDEGYLKVNDKSNLYYIIVDGKGYLAWENIDSISMYCKDLAEYKRSYYDVISGERVLSLDEYKSINCNERSFNKNVVLLSDLLKVTPGKDRLLSLNDVKSIINCREKSKVKKKTLKK